MRRWNVSTIATHFLAKHSHGGMQRLLERKPPGWMSLSQTALTTSKVVYHWNRLARKPINRRVPGKYVCTALSGLGQFGVPYVYIYIYMCVCVCIYIYMCVFFPPSLRMLARTRSQERHQKQWPKKYGRQKQDKWILKGTAKHFIWQSETSVQKRWVPRTCTRKI